MNYYNSASIRRRLPTRARSLRRRAAPSSSVEEEERKSPAKWANSCIHSCDETANRPLIRSFAPCDPFVRPRRAPPLTALKIRSHPSSGAASCVSPLGECGGRESSAQQTTPETQRVYPYAPRTAAAVCACVRGCYVHVRTRAPWRPRAHACASCAVLLDSRKTPRAFLDRNTAEILPLSFSLSPFSSLSLSFSIHPFPSKPSGYIALFPFFYPIALPPPPRESTAFFTGPLCARRAFKRRRRSREIILSRSGNIVPATGARRTRYIVSYGGNAIFDELRYKPVRVDLRRLSAA